MASQEEDNKLECISNVNKEQERYFLNVYKKHECILNNKHEKFEHKVESLIDVWKSLGELNLSQFDIRHVIQIMDWAKLHALNIVLTAEWNEFKVSHQDRLLNEIEKAQNELLKLNSAFATRCKKLADVVKNPWEDPVLMKLMKTKDAEIGPEEIEFFCVETAYVVSVRLKKLCESHCEDLALNLVTAFMNCNKMSKLQNFNLNATETQMWFIFDIHIALLYKFQEKQKIVVLLKGLTFGEGLQLVKRFSKKRVKISKIWKNCNRVAVLATQMYISQAVVKYTEDLKDILESYIETYISLCNRESLLQDFPTSIRRISNLADAAGLYVFCDVIQRRAGTELKPFVIEMYIRALTTDMNELERQKDANEKEKVEAITSRLALAFCNLADFLDEHVKVARECVLTAFSLEPTKERLISIEKLARRSGFQVLDTGQQWKCKLHPPVLPSDDITWICPECGDWMCKPQLNIPLKINMALNEALQNSVLGISEALCDDLVVCLSNPRYQILSWFLPWDDLHRLCIMYLQDPQTTKNFVTELKFVDIDYSIFKGIKREPLDELAGIERGYEQYLDQDFVSDEDGSSSVSGDSVSQDSRPYSLGSDGAGDGPYIPLFSAQPKSDPNTLKSLRMFRPNLKRSRNIDPSESLPEKLQKGNLVTNIANQPHTSHSKDPSAADYSKSSLSNFLNGIGISSLSHSVNTNNQGSQSKNVKAATLPSLGGQVAKHETEVIQVKTQTHKSTIQKVETSCQTSKSVLDQALKPYNQSSSTISETTRRDLMLKLLNKPSLSGSKENNNLKLLSNQKTEKIQDLPYPTQETKGISKIPTKLNKESKILTTTPKTCLQQTLKTDTVQLSSREKLPPNTQAVSLDHQQNKNYSMDQLPSTSQSNQNHLQTIHSSSQKTIQQPPPIQETKQLVQYRSPKKIPIVSLVREPVVCLDKLQLQDNKITPYPSQETKQNTSQHLIYPTISEKLQKPIVSHKPGKVQLVVPLSREEVKNLPITSVVTSKSKEIKKDPCTDNKKSSSKLSKTECKIAENILKPTDDNCTVQKKLEAKEVVKINSDKNECKLDMLSVECNNNGIKGSHVQNEVNDSNELNTGGGETSLEKNVNSDDDKTVAQQVMGKNCLGVIDDGIFSDLSDSKSDDMLFENNNDYLNVGHDMSLFESSSDEDLPKNFNLTENIRTYTKKSKILPVVNKDCVNAPAGDDKLDICKNVNNSSSDKQQHSSVQNPQTNCKELKIILYRLPSNTIKKVEEHLSIKKICDRGKTPPKNTRRRRSMDKSDNKNENAPNRVQNLNLSPLKDVNSRVTPTENSKSSCDDLNRPKDSKESMNPHVMLERIHVDNRNYARSVLANVPGLNDFQMIRPANVDHIVNVVQVSGGRTNQNVSIQNTQTSTQVTPHIQRIGQPRVTDQKPEHTSSITSTTTVTTTTTTAKTSTSQPSTLINILSQQIIRPMTSQSNTVRRQAPLINILSQQIIRPSQPQIQKTMTNSNVPPTENNQVKPLVTSDQVLNNQVNNVVKNTTANVKNTNVTGPSQAGTIFQFICKSTLPKFQQAFGKSVYQNNTEVTNATTGVVETNNVTIDAKKNITTKTVPVNVQPIQGSVIYSRQMPVGQTISLIPPGGTTRQVFRIASSNSEQISLVKDSVIHSKMSALLAAALQGRPKNSDTEQVNNDEKVTLTRPTLVQNARIVKPVQLVPQNVVRAAPNTNVSSTTLEQLREFDLVYKQIKERSNSSVPTETTNVIPENQEVTQQRISVTYVNQLQKYTQLSPVVVVSSYNNLQPAASPALSVTSQGSSSPCVTPAPTPTLPKIATKSSKGKTLKNTTNNSSHPPKSSPIPKPQQKPQEDEHTTQRIFDILAEYAEQLRNSPDLNNKPAPRRRSNPPTNPSQNSKRKKSSSGSKKSGQSSSTMDIDTDDVTVGSEDSSGGGIVQLSVTDDEQSQAGTVNTPESTETSSPTNSRQVILTDGTSCGNQSRNLIIADSSVGEALKMPNTAVIVPGSYIMPVSMVKGGQQIAVVSGGSKILATVPARSGQNMLLFQSFMNQNRKGAISAVKYSTIQPISGISSQSLAGVSAQPPVILPSNSVATAVALGQPLTLKKLHDDRDGNELLLTISHAKDHHKNPNGIQQPDSSTSVSSDSGDIKMEEATLQSDNSSEIFQNYQKSVITNSVPTSVIATTSTSCIKTAVNQTQSIINMNLSTDNIKGVPKPSERMQSVLVTPCSSNGPMLSHTTPRYRKPSDTGRINNNDLQNKEFLHNGGKMNNNEQKTFRTTTAYYTNRVKKNAVDCHKIDSDLQKQAAIERELRLQKSLSEECEDLGVDEPSTSDLFPEADLLFDSNHSPSFDQSSQDIIKRSTQTSELKEEVKATMNLFSDDETSSSLKTDLFEYVEYQTVETALDYQARQLMNGNTTSNESGSSGCEDNTLLPRCATMSEVTLNSPISPEMYTESSLNKYKFKYSNRKKGERAKNNDFCGDIVSSSEDTVGSTELGRINCEDENYKVVHVAITKTEIVKGERCELHCDEDLDSASGRGARRSVRKLCSCCNGTQDGNISRKRPHSSRPHTPATPHKKAFLNKKR